ncbi:hypothetical protein SAMN04490182_4575 [Pseudomonas cedrina]|uniref:Uncharacterized protein n=2 Tax=Pseudomonas cedrina TaxID=651740 RepID=A0A1V2K503_PSECE|nr:hypothetical protein [Pseudomonas cedrina]ONH52793.1 hypothetical protein BLL36_18125 [Pseudomonas cedrina subsp. cedrina]SDT42350.1 hypothetical protein SAMN04490182_4575 [Pseudomonas cedrina]
MKQFNLMDFVLGRSTESDPLVAGEAIGALQSALEDCKPSVLPVGAVVAKAPEHPEANRIAASIRDFPEDWAWARKGFDLLHIPSGFRLWVANDDYGLAEVHPNNGKTDFTKPEQAIIWPAVAEWLGHRKSGFTGKLPKATITGRSGTFWCYSKEHPWAGAGSTPAEAYEVWCYAISAQARNRMSQQEYLEVRSVSL